MGDDVVGEEVEVRGAVCAGIEGTGRGWRVRGGGWSMAGFLNSICNLFHGYIYRVLNSVLDHSQLRLKKINSEEHIDCSPNATSN